MLSLERALDKLLAVAKPVEGICFLPLTAALGRVLAAPQYSNVNVPPLDNSAMDGYAVRLADISVVGIHLPISQRIPAGTIGTPLQPGTAARIFTGAPVPDGADAVVMQEFCQPGETRVAINRVPVMGENIRRAGEDIAVGAEIFSAGTKLRPQDIALAASIGLPELPVYRRVRVGMFFTGNELVQPGNPLPPGTIYDANRYALNALLDSLGCEVSDLGIIPDSLEATRSALTKAAADNDLIISCGGMSVGEEDHVKPAVEAEGRLDLWKIAIKPGKPLAFGEIKKPDGKVWFIGLPGNPVSAMVTFMVVVRPFLLRLQGVTTVTPRSITLPAAFDWLYPDTRTEFLRARIGADGVELYPNQGSAILTSLCWGDGLVMNPPELPIHSGDLVHFLSFSELLS